MISALENIPLHHFYAHQLRPQRKNRVTDDDNDDNSSKVGQFETKAGSVRDQGQFETRVSSGHGAVPDTGQFTTLFKLGSFPDTSNFGSFPDTPPYKAGVFA